MIDCVVSGNTSPAGVVSVSPTPSAPVQAAGLRGTRGAACRRTTTPGPFRRRLIEDCEFIRNRGAGSRCLNLQSAYNFVVERCLFLENVAETASGAAIRTMGSSGEIRFNVFAYDSCYASTSRWSGYPRRSPANARS